VRAIFFGTYDAQAHPRVAVLRDGLRAHGLDVVECNAPLGLSTAERVALLRQPWRLPLLAARILRCWAVLAVRGRRLPRPDVVVVGYLGHFDVRLARWLWRRTPVVLDHLVGASDTARDRGVRRGLRQRLLRRLDDGALRAADVVVVDTDEHRAVLDPAVAARAVVVPVGAPEEWFRAARPGPAPADRPVRAVFFGLYTPLQGTETIGRALAGLGDADLEVTMVGSGQDLQRCRELAGDNPGVTWLDWVEPGELPALVADHDICLGIFGTGPKALRVVPNKVFQGAAAGCALVTSDTPPQRRTLGAAARLVPPGDPVALAAALRALSTDRAEVDRLRAAAGELARTRFTPERATEPLVRRLCTSPLRRPA
jgi:glycosyltransferase involved in cell wall biosynthesis